MSGVVMHRLYLIVEYDAKMVKHVTFSLLFYCLGKLIGTPYRIKFFHTSCYFSES